METFQNVLSSEEVKIREVFFCWNFQKFKIKIYFKVEDKG